MLKESLDTNIFSLAINDPRNTSNHLSSCKNTISKASFENRVGYIVTESIL